ncbi:unnamed protein product [Phytophthora lilii]|uniref:Unnamed protein product n=1 Tax=Phytophthora lilii TaxID=2077276 RepID=A0A9W6WRH8_9STRA|nr:unnamed protein product [Phytophthora lilii]
MTVTQNHPVSGDSVACVLDKLQLYEMAMTHPDRVALIFVTPEEIAHQFEGQELTFNMCADQENVRKLNGVGKSRGNDLSATGIHTVGNLRSVLAASTNYSKKFHFLKVLPSHRFVSSSQSTRSWKKRSVCSMPIPQFV